MKSKRFWMVFLGVVAICAIEIYNLSTTDSEESCRAVELDPLIVPYSFPEGSELYCYKYEYRPWWSPIYLDSDEKYTCYLR